MAGTLSWFPHTHPALSSKLALPTPRLSKALGGGQAVAALRLPSKKMSCGDGQAFALLVVVTKPSLSCLCPPSSCGSTLTLQALAVVPLPSKVISCGHQALTVVPLPPLAEPAPSSPLHAQHNRLLHSQEGPLRPKSPGAWGRQYGLGSMAWTSECLSPGSRSRAGEIVPHS